jgi:glucose 1-dehydrogenase
MSVTDQVVFVTGASRGIGRAIALAFAQAGAHVAINDYQAQDEAQALAREIEQLGRRALVVLGDVSQQAVVEGLIQQTVDSFGRLDHLVTNAVYSDREPFYSANMDGFHRTIDVTMWGAFYALRAAANQFIKQGRGGSAVIISSPHAFIPVPNAMAYNMAKAALDSMARTAAIELIEHKIRVNVIHPGWVDTPGERKFASEQEISRAGAMLPWGRMARPEEIARGVLFLADSESEYISGAQLLIDGGNTLPWWARGGMAVPK